MGSVFRDKAQAEQLCCALQVASNVCRHQRHAEEMFYRCAEDGTLLVLAELLQHHREQEAVFSAGTSLLGHLAADPGRAEALGRLPEVMTKLEGVARLLNHKLQSSASYLAKLEGAKGSDISARQATRTLVQTQNKLAALQQVLAASGACDVDAVLVDHPLLG